MVEADGHTGTLRLRPSLPLLVVILAACSAAMTAAAGNSNRTAAALAAVAFAVALIAAVLATYRENLHSGLAAAARPPTPRAAMFVAALFTMAAYLWGGVTMLAIYLGSGVHWQHGWQYGGMMLIVAAGHAAYLMRLADPQSPAAGASALSTLSKLALLQAAAIAVGLLWLIISGKLATSKGDWAANQIFLSGGAAIIGISLIAAKAHATLTRRSD